MVDVTDGRPVEVNNGLSVMKVVMFRIAWGSMGQYKDEKK